MLVTELIAKLCDMVAKHGDMPIAFVDTSTQGPGYPVWLCGEPLLEVVTAYEEVTPIRALGL